jgi:hypothetical protein
MSKLLYKQKCRIDNSRIAYFLQPSKAKTQVLPGEPKLWVIAKFHRARELGPAVLLNGKAEFWVEGLKLNV